jgi:hypothetical protein
MVRLICRSAAIVSAADAPRNVQYLLLFSLSMAL